MENVSVGVGSQVRFTVENSCELIDEEFGETGFSSLSAENSRLVFLKVFESAGESIPIGKNKKYLMNVKVFKEDDGGYEVVFQEAHKGILGKIKDLFNSLNIWASHRNGFKQLSDGEVSDALLLARLEGKEMSLEGRALEGGDKQQEYNEAWGDTDRMLAQYLAEKLGWRAYDPNRLQES